MNTEASFSGKARSRAVVRDQVDLDEDEIVGEKLSREAAKARRVWARR